MSNILDSLADVKNKYHKQNGPAPEKSPAGSMVALAKLERAEAKRERRRVRNAKLLEASKK